MKYYLKNDLYGEESSKDVVCIAQDLEKQQRESLFLVEGYYFHDSARQKKPIINSFHYVIRCIGNNNNNNHKTKLGLRLYNMFQGWMKPTWVDR